MILTTTNRIEGKEITEYLGLVYGTHIYLVGGLIGGGMGNQEKLFGAAYSDAVEKMVHRAAQMGADAIVGIQVNYSSPGNVNSMIVVVTGTAVKTGYDDALPEL